MITIVCLPKTPTFVFSASACSRRFRRNNVSCHPSKLSAKWKSHAGIHLQMTARTKNVKELKNPGSRYSPMVEACHREHVELHPTFVSVGLHSRR
ncbi:hypothetical protein CEXT_116951 [Caerostris extrusa]|uniref:Uncharacterized protein n=1 Tax=Caerostris extrusa TaxID=172846 RepID=A0AAV4XZE0_CAEEX|nr:hypothetical protein CEXT_116951 [Caerostris extrusa]